MLIFVDDLNNVVHLFLGRVQSDSEVPVPAVSLARLHPEDHLHSHGVVRHGEAASPQVRKYRTVDT